MFKVINRSKRRLSLNIYETLRHFSSVFFFFFFFAEFEHVNAKWNTLFLYSLDLNLLMCFLGSDLGALSNLTRGSL